MKKTWLLFIIGFVLAVPQHSIAQSTEEKVRTVSAGIGVLGKMIDGEIKDRRERNKREEELNKQVKQEHREARERQQAQRVAEARAEMEKEERKRNEMWEAKIARADKLMDENIVSKKEVLAGRKDYKTHNSETHILTERATNDFLTDRMEIIRMSMLNWVDGNATLTIKYYQNGDYCSIRGQNMSFQKVAVWIRWQSNYKWELVYEGPWSVFLQEDVDYAEKLSKAFPVPSNMSISMYDIYDIEIYFNGGQITTYY